MESTSSKYRELGNTQFKEANTQMNNPEDYSTSLNLAIKSYKLSLDNSSNDDQTASASKNLGVAYIEAAIYVAVALIMYALMS